MPARGFDVRQQGRGAAPPAADGLRLERSPQLGAQGRWSCSASAASALAARAVDAEYRVDLAALRGAIAAGSRAPGVADLRGRQRGHREHRGHRRSRGARGPLAREGTSGFHVDGAVGALAALSPALRAPAARASRKPTPSRSILHKWGHFPYEAGCVLVRDPLAPPRGLASRPRYLAPAPPEGWPAGTSASPTSACSSPGASARSRCGWRSRRTGSDRLGRWSSRTWTRPSPGRARGRERASWSSWPGAAEHRVLPVSGKEGRARPRCAEPRRCSWSCRRAGSRCPRARCSAAGSPSASASTTTGRAGKTCSSSSTR